MSQNAAFVAGSSGGMWYETSYIVKKWISRLAVPDILILCFCMTLYVIL
ncbi:MAG TPA: hypothetical protein VI278_18885 [Nitrososphaeraceae archaeon]